MKKKVEWAEQCRMDQPNTCMDGWMMRGPAELEQNNWMPNRQWMEKDIKQRRMN